VDRILAARASIAVLWAGTQRASQGRRVSVAIECVQPVARDPAIFVVDSLFEPAFRRGGEGRDMGRRAGLFVADLL
jgi:hypothetical protein